MTDRNTKRLNELLKKPGNDQCADCGLKGPEWASHNLGVFLCTTCASGHRNLGSHLSKVKSLKLGKWEDPEVEALECGGNILVAERSERCVPSCYRRPKPGDPHVLIEQWIRAKYERKEFENEISHDYTKGEMRGNLMKKAKDENKYFPRYFILSETENYIKYFPKESSKEAKATLVLSDVNVCLAPAKMHQDNGMQLSYITEGSTRHLYVCHDSGHVIINWYMAIRSAKLNRLMVAYPSATEKDLVPYLSTDFALEGYLSKTGPNEQDAYRRRWFILDHRKLMYHSGQMDAYPRGEIFLGHRDDGYSVTCGAPKNCKDQGFPFSLRTPERTYVLSAPSADERQQWLGALGSVLATPLRPQDNLRLYVRGCAKRFF